MDKDSLIYITIELYKMTLLFPKKEPLRYKMRGLADDILANLISWQGLADRSAGQRDKDLIFTIDRDLEILDSYFRVAEEQNWVSPSALLEIKTEYDKIKGKIEKGGDFEIKKDGERLDVKEEVFSINSVNKQIEIEREKDEEFDGKQKALDVRKERILDFLKEKGTAQVWEINKILSDVSKRTLRRDFQQLLKQGLIERIGQRNETFYRLKIKEI